MKATNWLRSPIGELWTVWEKYPLALLTTWGIHGNVCLIVPSGVPAVCTLLKTVWEQNVDIGIIGGGSNVLISNESGKLVLLHTASMNSFGIVYEHPYCVMVCEAGVNLRDVFAYTIKRHFSGLEFAVGIPGTMGGAIIGNAGASGYSIGDLIDWVEMAHPDGVIQRWNRDEIIWGYRYCSLSENRESVVVRCALRLTKDKPETILSAINAFSLKKRHQPLNKKTAGCVFKNPLGNSAGKLLDAAGCKGMVCGDARISYRHANFIENIGEASAQDIFNLAEKVKKRVYDLFGVIMEYEVKFIGEFL